MSAPNATTCSIVFGLDTCTRWSPLRLWLEREVRAKAHATVSSNGLDKLPTTHPYQPRNVRFAPTSEIRGARWHFAFGPKNEPACAGARCARGRASGADGVTK